VLPERQDECCTRIKTEAAFQSFEENNIAYCEVAIDGSNHRSLINISNNNSLFFFFGKNSGLLSKVN